MSTCGCMTKQSRNTERCKNPGTVTMSIPMTDVQMQVCELHRKSIMKQFQTPIPSSCPTSFASASISIVPPAPQSSKWKPCVQDDLFDSLTKRLGAMKLGK